MPGAPRALVFEGVRTIAPGARDAGDPVDVVVEDGVVTRVGPRAGASLPEAPSVVRVRRPGALVLPGFVDLHVHLREPGDEHKEDVRSGLRAAAAGGFVAVCPMPNTRPVNDSRLVTELVRAKAKDAGLGVRVHPIGAVTVGQRGEALTEMADLRDAGCVGVSDDGRCVTSSAVMRRALQYARTFDLVVIQHAEDHALTDGAVMHEGAVSTRLGLRGWPRVAEDAIVARDLLLAADTGARYHLAHASTAGSAALLREAKARGLRVSAEVTPHHLLLTHEALLGYRTACKVNPPLREAEDVAALVEALADGTLDCVATDHAPHAPSDKARGMDGSSPGLVGLETCFPLLYGLVEAGRLGLGRLVEALTTAPARVAGVEAPAVREGAPARLALVDVSTTFRLEAAETQSKSTNSPFWGREVRGRVLATVADGVVAHDPLGLCAEATPPGAPR